MSKLNQTYKDLAVPHFAEVFEIIDQVMKEYNVPYYLIGASAIALQLLKDGIKPSRGTKDIDFAMMLSSMKEFEEISKALEERGFRKAKAPWTYFYEKDDVALDLLPFGEIQENDTEDFNKRNSDLHIIGFQEVLENPTQISIEEKWVNIPPLAGMVLLKLVAWSDRPEERENDLSDILKIIHHYYDIEFDKIANEHYDTLEKEDLDERMVSAEVLGREAKYYLDKSATFKNHIVNIIERQLDNEMFSQIARSWSRISGGEVEYSRALLKAFYSGISQNR